MRWLSLHIHELEQKLGIENGMDTTQSIEEKQVWTWTESDSTKIHKGWSNCHLLVLNFLTHTLYS